MREIDLSEFQDLTARGASVSVEERKALEEERKAAVARRFPSTATLRWEVAFRNDPDLLGRILRDVLRLDRATPGRAGPRRHLDPVADGAAVDRIRGLDPARRPYSLLPFPEALELLVEGRTVRWLAARTRLPQTRAFRLRKGLVSPTMAELERIAAAFDRHPSYFLEYRVRSIHHTLVEEMTRAPEVSIRVYERLWQEAL